MATTFTINGTTYNFPTQGDDPPWGDEVVQLITAMVNTLNTLSGTGDILTTNFTVGNNVSSSTNVTGLNFDPTVVRSALISYSIYRSSNTPTELSESGMIYVTYKSTAGTWEIAQNYAGNSGMNFTMTNGGQIQYTSTNIGSGAYVGKMKFSAKAFTQT